MTISETSNSIEAIAIIGMAGRFPGAKNIDEFWQNLRDGVESISWFTDEELIAAGIDSNVLAKPDYVKAGATLENIDLFDASFFGFNPQEASRMDPQHRIFLECAWEALEDAGYDSQTYSGKTGVYAGVGWNGYLLFNVAPDREFLESAVGYQTLLGNDKDFLTTRVSYQLNLKGPSIDVQTACSTSLVAVSMACQSLLDYQCDLALAGGVTVASIPKTGYLYQEGGILSPDGHCRPFDDRAAGTVPGNGAGIVVLKRLEEAIADGDCIHAVIRGAAINNDGAMKVGYTAPSIDGQAEVIAEAIALAGVEPETISYIEAHGTGTALGDPIEIAALTQVFGASTDKQRFCALGSVKTNIGHLDAAAGIAGLIKTVLALKHQLIPPSLHFQQPNPKIDFSHSPFYVNHQLREWKSNGHPRRAGVSSFGIGGTNAHVVLEEGERERGREGERERKYQLLVLSAKTSSVLEAATENLAAHLQQHPDLNLADVAYTLQVGRRSFAHRRMVVCQDLEDAIETLKSQDFQSFLEDSKTPTLAFMFPGQGTQYVGMGKELYQTEPVFQEEIDRCCELLKPHLGVDLRSLIYPDSSEIETAERLKATAIAQPALFVIEYALARLWMSWGISPQAAIGHSIGEYVAATLAGVFSLEDALALVATRGRLMQQLPAGAMLSVALSEEELLTGHLKVGVGVRAASPQEIAFSDRYLLDPNKLSPECFAPTNSTLSFHSTLNTQHSTLSVAAINAPNSCVVSGTEEAIAAFQDKLQSQGISCRCLHTSHAFHSPMMDGILAAFRQEVEKVKLHSPSMPFISNVTGTWIAAVQAIDPNYWAQHLRQTVRFADGISELLKDDNRILLEVGAGNTLCTLANKQSSGVALPSLPHPQQPQSDVAFLLNTLGKLWLSGVTIDWFGFYAHQRRYRLPLPTYPFERQRYWIDRKAELTSFQGEANPKSKIQNPKSIDWFYVPSWKLAPLSPLASPVSLVPYLVFVDECGLGERLLAKLKLRGEEAIAVRVGSQFAKLSHDSYTINPLEADDYKALVNTLIAQQLQPKAIAHFWNVTKSESRSPLDTHRSLLFLAQALGKLTDELQMAVISNHLPEVTGEEYLDFCKATLLGLVKVIPQEYPNIKCRSIDLVVPPPGSRQEDKAIDRLLQELQATSPPLLQGEGSERGLGFDTVIAYRGNHRWVQRFESVRLDAVEPTPRLRADGVYLITGGLGGIGLVLAEYLAQQVQAKLVLIGRSWFPEREEWQAWLANNNPQDAIARKIRQIQKIESLGAEVLVIQADVTNLEQMQQAVTQVQEHFGGVNGVIHAAGVPGGGAIQRQTAEMAESILAPKVRGTLVLKQIFQNVELDFLVLCSSLTAIEGGFGQADYASANAFLDAFARQETNSNDRLTVSINWDTWQEVGMAIEALEEAASTQVSEVLHPLFDEWVALDSETEVYISRFSIDKHWVLKEHRVMGKATLPATAYLEMARSAVSKYAENRAIEINDVYFLTPLVVEGGEEKEVQTQLTKRGNRFEFVISSQEKTGEWQEHAKGDLNLMELELPKRYDILEIEQSCQKAIVDRQPTSEYIEFGARWNNIRQLRLGENKGLALLELPPEFAVDIDLYQLHPALLDVATGFLSAEMSGIYLPFFCKKLKVKGALPKRIYSYVRCRETNSERSETMQFDISIVDEYGRELVEIEGYTLRKLRENEPQRRVRVRVASRRDLACRRQSEREERKEKIDENFGLEIANPGILESLKWRSHPRRQPGAGEVEIEVRAVGLNFKEVLIALGMLPIPPDLHFQFGLECAGEIVAIGDGVKGYAVGDEVMAFANACLSRYVTTSASSIASKPKHLNWEEAATIPIAFTTAYYSLVELGRLQSGESILIQAAAGGVGLAAVQIAQWVGAEIWATAGSSEKREFLHSLGIDRLMDSRTLDFADEVRQRTDGKGVDVVLNSLAGEFLTESLKVVASYGRFLEIGKRDILSHSQLDLGLFAKGLSFFAINLEPELPSFSRVWGEVVQRFHSKDFSPLPCRVFAITEVASALEYMARAKHIGKVVVSLNDREAWQEIDRELPSSPSPFSHAGEKGSLSPLPTLAEEEKSSLQRRFLQQGLSPEEGVTAFSRILASGFSQVLVSRRDLSDLGKQDLNLSLPATVSTAKPQSQDGYIPPQNEIEGTISAIWQEMLGKERVGVRDNFFDLGGDSLLLVQVRSKLHAALNCDISTADLFEYPTIAALAAYLSQKQAGETTFDPIRERAKRQQEAEMELMQHSGRTI